MLGCIKQPDIQLLLVPIRADRVIPICVDAFVFGDVLRPGVYELPMGTSLRDLVFKYGGGMLAGVVGLSLLGGLIWLATGESDDAGHDHIRRAVRGADGHATLIRGSPALRGRMDGVAAGEEAA